MNKNQIIILGSGTSTGIPMTGCSCRVCCSTDPYDKRLRTSVILQTANGKSILIDTSPDLRQQMLVNKIKKIDCVIITHTHADHLHGIDDLRPFCFDDNGGHEIPVYSSPESIDEIKQRFPYIFSEKKKKSLGGGIPLLTLHPIDINHPFNIGDNSFQFFLFPHGHMNTLSFIHQKLGHIIDCEDVPAPAITLFKKEKLELLIIDCLRIKPHRTHLHFEKSIQIAKEIGAKKTLLIHFSHHLSHQEIVKMANESAPNIFPAYDGAFFDY